MSSFSTQNDGETSNGSVETSFIKASNLKITSRSPGLDQVESSIPVSSGQDEYQDQVRKNEESSSMSNESHNNNHVENDIVLDEEAEQMDIDNVQRFLELISLRCPSCLEILKLEKDEKYQHLSDRRALQVSKCGHIYHKMCLEKNIQSHCPDCETRWICSDCESINDATTSVCIACECPRMWPSSTRSLILPHSKSIMYGFDPQSILEHVFMEKETKNNESNETEQEKENETGESKDVCPKKEEDDGELKLQFPLSPSSSSSSSSSSSIASGIETPTSPMQPPKSNHSIGSPGMDDALFFRNSISNVDIISIASQDDDKEANSVPSSPKIEMSSESNLSESSESPQSSTTSAPPTTKKQLLSILKSLIAEYTQLRNNEKESAEEMEDLLQRKENLLSQAKILQLELNHKEKELKGVSSQTKTALSIELLSLKRSISDLIRQKEKERMSFRQSCVVWMDRMVDNDSPQIQSSSSTPLNILQSDKEICKFVVSEMKKKVGIDILEFARFFSSFHLSKLPSSTTTSSSSSGNDHFDLEASIFTPFSPPYQMLASNSNNNQNDKHTTSKISSYGNALMDDQRKTLLAKFSNLAWCRTFTPIFNQLESEKKLVELKKRSHELEKECSRLEGEYNRCAALIKQLEAESRETQATSNKMVTTIDPNSKDQSSRGIHATKAMPTFKNKRWSNNLNYHHHHQQQQQQQHQQHPSMAHSFLSLISPFRGSEDVVDNDGKESVDQRKRKRISTLASDAHEEVEDTLSIHNVNGSDDDGDFADTSGRKMKNGEKVYEVEIMPHVERKIHSDSPASPTSISSFSPSSHVSINTTPMSFTNTPPQPMLLRPTHSESPSRDLLLSLLSSQDEDDTNDDGEGKIHDFSGDSSKGLFPNKKKMDLVNDENSKTSFSLLDTHKVPKSNQPQESEKSKQSLGSSSFFNPFAVEIASKSTQEKSTSRTHSLSKTSSRATSTSHSNILDDMSSIYNIFSNHTATPSSSSSTTTLSSSSKGNNGVQRRNTSLKQSVIRNHLSVQPSNVSSTTATNTNSSSTNPFVIGSRRSSSITNFFPASISGTAPSMSFPSRSRSATNTNGDDVIVIDDDES